MLDSSSGVSVSERRSFSPLQGLCGHVLASNLQPEMGPEIFRLKKNDRTHNAGQNIGL